MLDYWPFNCIIFRSETMATVLLLNYWDELWDQMARLFLIIWLPTTTQICTKFLKIAKVSLQFCHTQNKSWKVCPRFLKVCPSGEISPNLLTLETSHHGNHLATWKETQLSGFVYTFQSVAPGSNPKHSIYAFVTI